MTSRTKQIQSGDATSKTNAARLTDHPRLSRKAPRLEITAESPKPDAHLLFMREFLAPLLAKEFLRQRRAAISVPISEVNANVPTFKPPVGGMAVEGHSRTDDR